MGKGGKTTQTSSNKVDPEQMKLFMQNYRSGQDVANMPFQAYTGERVAPGNPALNQSFDMFGNIGTNNTGASTLDWAKNLTQRGANYQFQPLQVGDVAPHMLANTDLSPYMNPFSKGVMDTTLTDLERSRQMQQSRDAAKATAAGAFGGSRSGVMAAETNRAYDQNAANTLANLNLQNFNQAQNAAIGDITRDFAARQANQSTALQLGALNTNAGLDAARLGLSAGAQMGALSGQELSQALQRAGALNQVGQQQRTIQQQMDDAAYQEFLRQIAYPIEQQQIRNQSLGLIPIQQTTTAVTKQPADLGGLGSLLQGAASIAPYIGFSDARLKSDVTTTAFDGKGRRWVSFRYLWDSPQVRRLGVIAQEVARSDPEAVARHASGYLVVDYAKLGVRS